MRHHRTSGPVRGPSSAMQGRHRSCTHLGCGPSGPEARTVCAAAEGTAGSTPLVIGAAQIDTNSIHGKKIRGYGYPVSVPVTRWVYACGPSEFNTLS